MENFLLLLLLLQNGIIYVTKLQTIHVKVLKVFGKEIWIVPLTREHRIQLFLKMGFISRRTEVNLP